MSEPLLGSELDAMVTAYLEELSDALRRLPTSRRDHLISEIREHIVEMRAERPVRDRSDMEALLNRVGLPEDIAAVALEDVEDTGILVDEAGPHIVVPSGPRFLGGRVSKRTFMIGTAGAAVVLFGILVGVAIGNHRGQTVFGIVRSGNSVQPVFTPPAPPTMIREAVPNLIGESQTEAAATLSAAGLTFSVENSSSATTPAGVVVSQDPSAGSLVPSRRSVTIFVSTGPASTTS
jgi:PASTA domain